jgi:hypothetical protein
MLAALPALARGGPNEVDLELILSVDVSYSMDMEEQRLQREGYIEALNSPQVLQAIKQGMLSRIAVTYVEWAGSHYQRVVVPWQVIEGPESARAFTDAITKVQVRREFRTSISGAIDHARQLFENNGFDAPRRVVDISGDGANNNGRPVHHARDEALRAGIVINGLPVMTSPSRRNAFDMEALDEYYRDCVIGGPGSFLIPITERSQFLEAIRTKIIREIASAPLPSDDTGSVRIVPAQSQPDTRRADCLTGEKQWQERYRN